MRLLSFLLAACALVGGLVQAAPGDPHAREHQNTPLWINIPVSPSDLDYELRDTGLTADVYADGKAYVQILTYNLDKLETWAFGKWFDVTFTPGWVSKLNILVKGPKGPGYMIRDIDFQLDNFVNWFTGLVRNVGAVFDQKIPSHPCAFRQLFPTSSNTLSAFMDCQFSYSYWDNKFPWFHVVNVRDGFTGTATYTQGAGNGVATDAFVNWAVVRNNKYLKQNDGTVVWADVTYPNITAGLDQWYPVQASDNSMSVSMLKSRLGLTNNYPICSLTDKNYCFWASYYGLIDHENTVIQKAKTNEIDVDASLAAPSTSTTSSAISNDMIWLYGILVGVGASMVGVLTVYAIITYRARGQQVLKATHQHATAVELP